MFTCAVSYFCCSNISPAGILPFVESREFQRKNSAMGDLYGSIIDKPRTSPAKTSVLGVSRSTIQGSRHVLGGSGAEHSRPGVAGKQSEAIKVFDDEGNDVTPLPLLAPPKGFPPGKAALTGASGSDIQNPKTSIVRYS